MIQQARDQPLQHSSRRRKLVLLITKTEIGGATRHVRDLAVSLKDKYEILVISELEHENSWLYAQLRLHQIPYFPSPFLCHKISLTHDSRFLIWLYKFCRQEAPDILHIHSSKAGILGRIAGTRAGVSKVIFTVHGISFQSKYSFIRRSIFLAAEKIAYHFCTDIICVSQHDKVAFLMKVPDTDNKVRVILNEIPAFTSIPFRKRNETFTFGFLGRLAFPKNPLFLLEGFQQLLTRSQANIRLLIKGDGPLLPEVKLKIANGRLGHQVELLPQDENIEEFLSEVDVLMLTSEFEGLPYVLLEGRSAGCYLISSNVGGCSEIIKNDSIGLLYEEGNIESFITMMSKALLTRTSPNYVHDASESYREYLDLVEQTYQI